MSIDTKISRTSLLSPILTLLPLSQPSSRSTHSFLLFLSILHIPTHIQPIRTLRINHFLRFTHFPHPSLSQSVGSDPPFPTRPISLFSFPLSFFSSFARFPLVWSSLNAWNDPLTSCVSLGGSCAVLAYGRKWAWVPTFDFLQFVTHHQTSDHQSMSIMREHSVASLGPGG